MIYDEPGGELVSARLVSTKLMAPHLIDFELTNIYLKKARRNPEQRGQLLRGFRLRRRLNIETFQVDFERVLALAETTCLTAYDASYLFLARQFDAELVTLDRQLEAAATADRL